MRKKKPKCNKCGDTGALETWSRECDETGADGAMLCSCTESQLTTLKRQLEVAERTLDRIGDPEPSIGRPPFLAWELRDIARSALAQIKAMRGGNSK